MKMDTQYVWKQMLKDLSVYLDRIILVAVFLAIYAGVILIFQQGSLFFGIVDFSFSMVFAILYFFRDRIGISPKIFIINVMVLSHSIFSLYYSGLVGTGITFLLLLQIIAIVFFQMKNAIIMGVLTIGIVLFFGLFSYFGYLEYGNDLLIKMNQPSQWLIVALALFIFFVISLTMIFYFRKKLIKNIVDLAQANEVLLSANVQLTESKRLTEKMAFFDPITGLPNRYKFEQLVQQRIDKYNGKGFILLINIKGFRIINSMLGSEAGDNILKTIAEVLGSFSNQNNIIARLGSDEFAAWVENWDDEVLDEKILKFHKEFHDQLPQNNFLSRIEFYISAVAYPDEAATLSQGLKKAGIALKFAKDSHSTGVMRFFDTMTESVESEMQMRKYIEDAVKDQEFYPVYQEKVDIDSQQIVGVEALARWKSAILGPVGPQDFIPIVTSSSLIFSFSQWMIEKVFSDFSILQEKYNKNLIVSINISPLFFIRARFVEYVVDLANQYQVPARQVVLEITEDIFIDDMKKINRIVQQLSNAGFQISLDDFGKGFSSLYYISNIDFNELKIDKSFIDNIAHDERSFGLFQSICNIADTLGFHVVAEGVETKEQVDKILTTSCHVVQGYYYSRPVPL